MRYDQPKSPMATEEDQRLSIWSKLAQVDTLGAFLMGSVVLTALLPMSLVSSSTDVESEYYWTDPGIIVSLVASPVLFIAFIFAEKRKGIKPLIPLEYMTNRSIVALTGNFMVYNVWAYSQVRSLNMAPV